MAKLFHPDKNPGGREHFTRVLKAYEVLSDPALKSSYDYRLLNGLKTERSPRKPAGTKTWSFDEKELKRRQYYNEHIKKYTRSHAHFSAPDTKSTYNEYKYILFATPLAVALFLLIMHLAGDPPHQPQRKTTAPAAAAAPALKTGDSPYSAFFGGARFDSLSGKQLAVQNNSGADIIVCLFASGQFLRSCFIENRKRAVLPDLPGERFLIYYSSGQDFGFSAARPGVEGLFTRSAHFYKSRTSTHRTSTALVLEQVPAAVFEEISESLFFAATHS